MASWRPVVSYGGAYIGIYEVSDGGLVRSIDRVDSYGRRGKGQALRPQAGRGRLTVKLSKDGRAQHAPVHHLVLEAFVGLRPHGLEGCHRDGNFRNNHVDNLRWGTSSSNKYDTVRHGNHWRAKRDACIRGHLLTGTNLLVSGRGRQCRSCNAGRSAHRRGRAGSAQEHADAFYRRLVAGGGTEYRRGGDRRSPRARGKIDSEKAQEVLRAKD